MHNFPTHSVISDANGADISTALQRAKLADGRSVTEIAWQNANGPVVLDGPCRAGFNRFEMAASALRHPSTRPGTLYALPIRDVNKPIARTAGVITITPDPHRTLTQSYLRQLKLDAIEAQVKERGLLEEGRELGRFSVSAKPDAMRVSDYIRKNTEPRNDNRVLVLRNGQFVGIYDDPNPDSLVAKMVPAPTVDDVTHNVDTSYEFIMLSGENTFAFHRPVEDLAFDYVASVYDVTGDPDSWFFFGIETVTVTPEMFS